jgi:hypothetical protein
MMTSHLPAFFVNCFFSGLNSAIVLSHRYPEPGQLRMRKRSPQGPTSDVHICTDMSLFELHKSWVQQTSLGKPMSRATLQPSTSEIGTDDGRRQGVPGDCETALPLRSHAPSLAVVLLEASAYEPPRLGETLPRRGAAETVRRLKVCTYLCTVDV